MREAEAFFLPDGDRFIATAHTRGPWDDRHQHGGPPIALMGRALCRHVADAPVPLRLARLTCDLLGPVPVGVTSIETADSRPGEQVRWVSGRLAVDGREVLRASALFVRRKSLDLPPLPGTGWSPPTPPEELGETALSFPSRGPGYVRAMEIRVAEGTWGAGPTRVWMRPRLPLVAGEVLTPRDRALLAADSGNGVSPILDLRTHLFVNPELTVSFARLPVGDWICLDAATAIHAPDGIGLATTRLFDRDGPFGVGAQSLFVDERRGGR